MHQQVNLYEPIFRAEHRYFSARTIVVSLGVIAAGLAAITAFSWWRVTALERDLHQLESQANSQSSLASLATATLAQGESLGVIETRVAALSKELDRRQQALRYLVSGKAGVRLGFSNRMAALARRHVDGLWLTGVTLTSMQGQLALSGIALNADLVPAYLESLAAEPALAGARLDQFEIVAPKDTDRAGVDFSVSSSAVLPEEATRLAARGAGQ
jgi:Fimbrial assembly protein (PilN)